MGLSLAENIGQVADVRAVAGCHGLEMDDGATMDRVSLPTGTITVLLTDIERSTQGWEASAAAMAKAVRRHDEILAAAIEEYGGERPVEQGEGDSLVAGFAKASDAIAAALAGQRALAAEDWPAGLTIRVRMAMHSGEVRVIDGDRYAGPVIIRCARLRSLAHGGQVVVSALTRDLAIDSLPDGVSLVDLGRYRLRDLNRPEQVFELRHPDLGSFPVLVSPDAAASNVPEARTRFFGRAVELAAIHDALSHARLVTLTGAGGCGKTRLAQEAATALFGELADGVCWVDAAPVTEDHLVIAALAAALGLRDDPYRATLDVIIDHLRGSRMLVVLDNCEHLLDGAGSLVESLLRNCPEVRVLVTSREPLSMPGEIAWRVPSLPTEDSVALFAERAEAVRPNFVVTEENREIVERICRRLDGIPLAIELAAARTRMLSVAQIADGLDDRFRLLTGGHRAVVQRQRTLAASIDWSYELLDEAERAVFRRLTAFSGEFGLDAAEHVGSGDGVDPFDVLDLVGRLVDKSLIQVDERGAAIRYSMLETIRQYGHERLVQSGEATETRGRHLDWYASWIDDLGHALTSADHARLLDDIETELDNVRVALDWADASGAGDRLRVATSALTFFWMLHGHFHEGARRFDRALTIDDGPVARAASEWGRAYLALYGGEYDIAVALALQGYTTSEAAGDARTMARCLGTLATMQAFAAPNDAEDTALRAIELARETGDDWCLADSLQVLAGILAQRDEHRRAEPFLDEAFAIARRIDNRQLIAWHWTILSTAQLRRGELADAEASAQRGLAIAEEVGDLAIIGTATYVLGMVLLGRGLVDDAKTLLEECIDRLRTRGAGLLEGLLVGILACLYTISGDAPRALELVTRRGHEPTSVADGGGSQVAIAFAGAAMGAPETDEALADQLSRAIEAGNSAAVVQINLLRARTATSSGDIEIAERLVHDDLERLVELELWPSVIDAIEIVAACAALDGSDIEAARLTSVVARHRAALGLARSTTLPLDQRAIEADLFGRLTEHDLAEAAAATDTMTLPDLVTYVRRARGERRRPNFGWRSLTPTEEEVVALVADGLTNPQIAEKLFMSRSTVKTHLSHVFAKLEVSTRAELAAAAARRG